MIVGPGLFRVSDLTVYLSRPRFFLTDCLKALLLAYKAEEKSPAYLEGLQRMILDFCPFVEQWGLPQKVEELKPVHIRAHFAYPQEQGLAPPTRRMSVASPVKGANSLQPKGSQEAWVGGQASPDGRRPKGSAVPCR